MLNLKLWTNARFYGNYVMTLQPMTQASNGLSSVLV